MGRKFAVLAAVMLFVTMLAAAVAKAAPTSSAGTIRLGLDAPPVGKNFILTLKVTMTGSMDSAGGRVLIAPCYPGPSTLPLAHRTRHLAHGESLRPYSKPRVDWIYRFPARPYGVKRFVLKMLIPIVFGKGGSGFTFCAAAVAIDNKTGANFKNMVAFGVK